MKESEGSVEQRQHERAYVQTIVVGILNSGESVRIGSVADISMGGVKFTYHELKMTPEDSPSHSIDLIAENHNLAGIPCRYVWDDTVEKEPGTQLTGLRRCGIQFGTLTPNQTFLLKSFINSYAPSGINPAASNEPVTYN